MSTVLYIDDYDVAEFTVIAARYGRDSFDYVVTPNVDHLLRYHDDATFRDVYAHARYVLLDSRFLAYVLRVAKGINPRVCPGSDLTSQLMQIVAADDDIVLVGGTAGQARYLVAHYGLRNLRHYNPPMGFIRDPQAIEECLRFVETQSPFRFCLLAVGSPQQEILAHELQRRGHARGLAFCIGASINFLTRTERRAPRWMQRIGFEWLYRLLQNPGRLAGRYLLRGPRIFALLPGMRFDLRRRRAAARSSAVEK